MPIHGEGLVDDDSETQTQRTVYVLHPNCAIDEE
jgi:DNA replication licensing factor MCM6